MFSKDDRSGIGRVANGSAVAAADHHDHHPLPFSGISCSGFYTYGHGTQGLWSKGHGTYGLVPPMPVSRSKTALSPATAEFGRRVRARRDELGLSQEKLADAAGLHWTFVGQVERGRRNLTLHNILKLARALDVDAGTLVSELPALTV